MEKANKAIILLFALITLSNVAMAAGGSPINQLLSNPILIFMMSFVLVLALVIGGTGKLLLRVAKYKFLGQRFVMLLGLLLAGNMLFAQDATTATATTANANTVMGMSALGFYTMVIVTLVLLIIIIYLLTSIRCLLKKESSSATATSGVASKEKLSWWDRFNALVPKDEETNIDLGHDYDGIRELDNKLPPWWLWGFYLCIAIAIIYLLRFHVFYDKPNPDELTANPISLNELKTADSIAKASMGDLVDENSKTQLTDAADLEAGKKLFTTEPGLCKTCHSEDAGGLIGPNLTDDCWIHGGTFPEIFNTIKHGVPIEKAKTGQPMLPMGGGSFSGKQIAQLASYVMSLKGTKPAKPLPCVGTPVTVTATVDSTATAGK